MLINLKNLRIKKGISQQKLGEIVGVSQQSINKYENHDVEPDISTLVAFAEYFNTSIDYILGYSVLSRKNEAVSEYYLNKEEMEIIDSYRLLLKDEKSLVNDIMIKLNKYKDK